MLRQGLMAFSLVGWLAIGVYLFQLRAIDAPPPRARAPRLELEPRVIDLGVVMGFTRTRFSFEVRNRGSGVLKILDVGVSCGCLQVGLAPESTVAPGSNLTVNAWFDSSGFFGEMTKELTVKTNDPDRPMTSIIVRTSITPLLEGPPLLLVAGLRPAELVATGLDLRPGRPDLALELGRLTVDLPEVKLGTLNRIAGGYRLSCEIATSRNREGTLQVEVIKPWRALVSVPVRLEMAP